MRDPLGTLNPLRTQYVADLIAEVDRRMASHRYDDECNRIKSGNSEPPDKRKRKSRRLKRA
ncbi:MAG: hypothetical protein ACYS8W_16605 [Planctomycetota bacterium]|jgi:hypothetical protein